MKQNNIHNYNRRRYCGLAVLLLGFGIGQWKLFQLSLYNPSCGDVDSLPWPSAQEYPTETSSALAPLNNASFFSSGNQTQQQSEQQHLHQQSLEGWDEAKTRFCQRDPSNHKVVLDQIEIATSNITGPRILCYIPITYSDHNTKALEVFHTWGKRCDKLIFASDGREENIGAVNIKILNNDSTFDRKHLWETERETVRYIWQGYGKTYDWFLKADLDTYIIMENLKMYLNSEEIRSREHEPMILGRRLSMPKQFQTFSHNRTLDHQFVIDSNQTFRYTSGSAGYVMNKLYMKKFYESMDEYFCLSSAQDATQPEDVALSFCMAHLGIYPHNTRDELGRERFHPRSPYSMYIQDEVDENNWMVQFHEDIGGVKGGNECCSASSISFHGIKEGGGLQNLERLLYYCRT